MLAYHFQASRRLYTLALLSLGSFVLLFLLSPRSWFWQTVASNSKGFHFLIPATKPGPNLCKLFVSGAVNGYPDPVLIGWEHESQSHLLKITATLKYLKSMPKDADDDLVLMVDGYDVWLQLPPEIMIQRYYQALKKTNDRLKRQNIHARQRSLLDVPITNTIIGTAEAFPFPRNGPIPAWESLPDSTLPNTTLGPMTNVGGRMSLLPKYANTGSLMGPVKDLRNLFEAIQGKIDIHYDEDYKSKNSDQYYTAFVMADQERARAGMIMRHPQGLDIAELPRQWSVTDPKSDKRVEYHMSLDLEMDAFQLSEDWSEFVTFMAHNRTHSIQGGRHQAALGYQPGRLDTWPLSNDIHNLRKPFSMGREGDGLPLDRSWKDVLLAGNTVTGVIFPLYHVIIDKTYLQRWWSRLWWHPYGEPLLKAARRQRLERTAVGGRYLVAEVDGTRHEADKARKADRVEEMRSRDAKNEKGGVWSDAGEYLTWGRMCGEYEEDIFVEQIL